MKIDNKDLLTEEEFKAGKPGYLYYNYKTNKFRFKDSMKRFWISWYQQTEDHRPLVYPPNEGIIGWWCSGTRLSDGASTLVALVEVEREEDIPELLEPHWKTEERSEFRFIKEVSRDWKPSNRFPLSDWMKDRI